MKKLIFSLCIACCVALNINAQDEMIYNHYIINPVIVNPAASGYNGAQNFNIHYKNQWTGFTGAPRTTALNYHGAIGEKLGIGAWVSHESISYQNRLRGALSYAFRFKINDFKASIGLATEFKNITLDNSVLDNRLYKPGDVVAENYAQGVNIFDATVGFYGVYQDKVTMSFAMPNLIEAKLSANATPSNNSSGGFKYYNFMLGYKHRANAITIEPSIMLKKLADAPVQIDANLKGSFLEDRVMGAVSYRVGGGNGLGVMVGTKFNNITFAYSYDYGLQRFQRYSNGAHEITVGYMIQPKAKASDALIDRSTSSNYSN